VISGGSSHTWTFQDFAAAGVNMSEDYLNVTVVAGANSTTSTVVNLYGNDVPITRNRTISVKETVDSTPYVAKDFSWYVVTDKVSVSQSSSLNLTDVKVYLSYPSYSLSEPIRVKEVGTLNSSEEKSFSVTYEKKGPFVPQVKVYRESDNATVEMMVYSYEDLSGVKFEFDPTKPPWDEYFKNFGSIESVTLNGKSVSWKSGSVLLEGLELKKGYNELNVTYSYASGMVFVAKPTVPWWQKTYVLPVWMWMLLAALAAIAYAVGRSR